MIKLNYKLFDTTLDIKGAEILVLEDTQVFRSFIEEVANHYENDNLKIYDKNFECLKPCNVEIVTDILTFNLNNNSILKRIHNDLFLSLKNNIEKYSHVENLLEQIKDEINQELIEQDISLITTNELNINPFKIFSVTVRDNSYDMFEKIMSILDLFKYIGNNELVIFINICSYFTDDELNKIVEYINLLRKKVLFIEPRKTSMKSQYVFDNDFYML